MSNDAPQTTPIAIWTGKTNLYWRTDGWGVEGRALFAGGLHVGCVGFIQDRLYPGRPWRAWIMTEEDGKDAGHFETEQFAKDALVEGVTKEILK